MDRLISEKQLINAIKAWAIPLQVSNSETIENLWVNGVCELIKAIPSAEPKTGHWITTRTFMHDGEYYCDKCKCESPNNEKWDYCPNCGARMVEPQERSEEVCQKKKQ